VITDLGVFTLARRGDPKMVLIELADGVSLEEIVAKTEVRFEVALNERQYA
jgi:3-oxoacid CoA-transferase subunit B